MCSALLCCGGSTVSASCSSASGSAAGSDGEKGVLVEDDLREGWPKAWKAVVAGRELPEGIQKLGLVLDWPWLPFSVAPAVLAPGMKN